MRREVQVFINQSPEIKQYIRLHPIWYRHLARNPQSLNQLEVEVKHYYGKTLPQKLERFQSNLNMAMMLLQMAQGFGSSEGQV